MIYKYVTSREVIDKFFGDTGYEEDVPLADVIRWISEALDKIGVKMQYIRKIAGDKSCPFLTIVNHKAQLPCDFFKLEQIAINGMPAIASRGTFHHLVGKDCCTVEELLNQVTSTYTDNFGNEFEVSAAIGGLGRYTSQIEYDINDNFITTNVKEGIICMAYLAYPIDFEGFPMIPDDVYYIEAVAAYIRKMLDYRQWRKQPNQANSNIKQDSDREWYWYVGAAKGAGQFPDNSTMESWANSVVNIIPKLPRHNRFYKF